MLPLIGPAVTQVPAVSQTWTLFVLAFGSSTPAATFVTRLKDACAGLARPAGAEAVQAIEALADSHCALAVPQDTTGPLRSIRLPMIGPAVEQLPTASQTWTLFVLALASSAPAATFVTRFNEACDAVSSPTPPSVDVHAIDALVASQAALAEPQDTTGPLRSILLPVTGPAVEQLPTASQTWTLFVLAFAFSVPGATLVVSVTVACDGVARPDAASEAVQSIDALVASHCALAVPQDTTGPLRSILLPAIGPAVVQLAAVSHTVTLFVLALASSTPAATLVVRLNDACDGVARSDWESVAVQAIDALVPSHAALAEPQWTTGGVVSETSTANIATAPAPVAGMLLGVARKPPLGSKALMKRVLPIVTGEPGAVVSPPPGDTKITDRSPLLLSPLASRPPPGRNATDAGAPPTTNGESADSVSTLPAVENIDRVPSPLFAVARRPPVELKATVNGAAPVANGDPATAVGTPAADTVESETVLSVLLATASSPVELNATDVGPLPVGNGEPATGVSPAAEAEKMETVPSVEFAVASRLPVGLNASDHGFVPVANGEPGTSVSAPPTATVKSETVLSK